MKHGGADVKFYWNKELKGQMHSGNFLEETPKYAPGTTRFILHHLDYFYLYGFSVFGNFIGLIVKHGNRTI